jgi:AcrR family transcriptional regulator
VDLLTHPGRVRSRRGTRQAEKSAQTRRQILDAAITCLAEHGYSGTTMTGIARAAGLSRGAMQYHFETMSDVVAATLAYMHQLRLVALRHAAINASRVPNRQAFSRRVDSLWQFFCDPVGVAFIEISIASRTDAQLGALVRRSQAAFWDEWITTAIDVFPEWQDRREDLKLACGLAHTLLEGLALQEMTGQEGMVRPAILRSYLADRLKDIFDLGASPQ